MDEVAPEEGEPPNDLTPGLLRGKAASTADEVIAAEPAASAGMTDEPDTPSPDDEQDLPVDLARGLLARLRGERPAVDDGSAPVRRRLAGSARRFTGRHPRTTDREQWSGAGPDGLDPVRVGDVLAGFVAERGWDTTMAEARVVSDWATIVGAEVAAHCTPVSLRAGELHLAAESTAWATQLRMLAGTMVARIEAQIGAGVVRRITVTGPVGPSWRHGPRSVRGARGPRDTYG